MAKRKYTYIDLFSGSGGFSLGFDNANFENIFSVEFNHDICETYRHNFPSHTLLECDIADLTETEIKKIVGQGEYVLLCFDRYAEKNKELFKRIFKIFLCRMCMVYYFLT